MDYATQLCGDCSNPLQGSLSNNQYILESTTVFLWPKWFNRPTRNESRSIRKLHIQKNDAKAPSVGFVARAFLFPP